MSDPDPLATRRATWLVWAGGAALVLTLLVVSSWWWLPRYAPSLSSAIGTAIPALTRPLAEHCYAIGLESYNDALTAPDQARRQSFLRRAGAHLLVSRNCYAALNARRPADADLDQRMLHVNQLYFGSLNMLLQ